MAQALRDLLDSPLREAYVLSVISTYRGPGRVRRLAVFAQACVSLVRWCRGDGERLVHVHTAARGSLYRKAFCVALVRLARRPVVVHFHSGAGDLADFVARIGPVRRSLFGAALRAADAVLSVSSRGARELEAAFGVTGVEVVPNPAPALPPAPPAAGDQEPSILYLGGFANPSKGGEVLLRALPAIATTCPRSPVILAGPGAPPPDSLAGRNGHVRWLGWLDPHERDRRLSECEVFVMPSLSEGLPLALLEAMAHGRAIVASAVGGVPDVITDGVEGLLVAPGDPVALAEAVQSVAAAPALRTRLGEAARARARQLGRDEVARRIAAVYERIRAS
jgi:glycosyltransferase involved in cell wall biosynthesis